MLYQGNWLCYSHVLIEKVTVEHKVSKAHASMCVTHKRKLGPLDKKMTALLVLEGIELYTMSDLEELSAEPFYPLAFHRTQTDAYIKIDKRVKFENYKFKL